MLSPHEQSVAIRAMNEVNGFKYEKFRSAAGILGNFKIFLPEALASAPEAMDLVITDMIESTEDVDAIAATGGAVDLAHEIASRTGKELIEITSYKAGGRKQFLLTETARAQIAERPNVGLIEDVSSTFDTVKRAIASTGLIDLVTVVAVGLRRGETAPEGMSEDDIHKFNLDFAFRDLYEYPLCIPIRPAIERKIPLWIPLENQIPLRLPELAA